MGNENIKILAIDDNPDNLITMKAVLSDTLPEVQLITALDGPRGLALARVSNPDLILLDIIMPVMDGYEVCRQLKSDNDLLIIPVVFLTAAKTDRDSRIRALEAGAEGFLTKPIDETELIAQVRAMVRIKSANVQNRQEKEELARLIAHHTRDLEQELAERKKADLELQATHAELIQSQRSTLNLLEDLKEEIETRKQVEKALRESEAALQQAQSVAHVGSWVWHIAENRLEWSDEMYRIFGIARSEFTGNLADVIAKAIHPDDRAAVEQSNQSVALDKKPIPLEYRIVHPDGMVRTVWAEAGELILDPSGQPLILTGIVQDITERKRVTEELRKSEERLKQAVQIARLGIWDWDAATNRTNWYGEMFQIYGIKPEEFTGIYSDYYQMTRSDYREQQLDNIQNLFVKGITEAELLAGKEIKPSPSELCIVWPDGTEHYTLDDAIPIIDKDGNPVRTLGVTLDITERKQAENELRASELRFRTLIERAPVAITVTRNGVGLYANKKFLDMIGLNSVEETIGRPVADFYAPEFREASRQRTLQRANGQSTPSEFESALVHQNGTQIPVQIAVAYVQLSDGMANIAFVTDITERKRADDLIHQALREKETLLRELYHRTKNNMNVISAMLSLQAETCENEIVKTVFQETENKIRTMALVHQMLYQSHDLSRIDFHEYITDLSNLLVHNQRSSPIDISLQLDVQPVTVMIDSAIPCGLVINELFSNVFKHAFRDGKKGEVRVKLARLTDGMISLSVSDNGVGVPAGFDFRTQPTLGLQTIYLIVEDQLQGSVQFENHDGVTCHIQFSDSYYTPRV